jgi:hypothetical protein
MRIPALSYRILSFRELAEAATHSNRKLLACLKNFGIRTYAVEVSR